MERRITTRREFLEIGRRRIRFPPHLELQNEYIRPGFEQQTARSDQGKF